MYAPEWVSLAVGPGHGDPGYLDTMLVVPGVVLGAS